MLTRDNKARTHEIDEWHSAGCQSSLAACQTPPIQAESLSNRSKMRIESKTCQNGTVPLNCQME